MGRLMLAEQRSVWPTVALFLLMALFWGIVYWYFTKE